ncbi:MAG: glycosyltransferase family 2 protein [Syntrophorhabdaceae bacterium]|nr:glycosyltransferase family 2 protein [Syntrophorhabdaceae bacterium]
MFVTILIPAYNELRTLPLVIEKVVETPYDKEIIIVDDGSTDGTREWLRSLSVNFSEMYGGKGRGYTEVTVFFHEKNIGKGGAIRTGIDMAKGDIVVIQDADLEYDPRDYPSLFAPIIEGKADVVYGSRFLGGPHRVLFFWHYVGNMLITLFSNMLTDLNLTDMETGYKVFKREVLKRIKIESNGFGFEPEITAKVAKMGCRIYEVPISYYGRGYDEGKKITWKDGIYAIFAILKYNLFR